MYRNASECSALDTPPSFETKQYEDAKALGITIPQPLLLRADKVIQMRTLLTTSATGGRVYRSTDGYRYATQGVKPWEACCGGTNHAGT